MAKKDTPETTDGNRFVAQAGTILTGNEALRYRLERLVATTPDITASDAAHLLGVSRRRPRGRGHVHRRALGGVRAEFLRT